MRPPISLYTYPFFEKDTILSQLRSLVSDSLPRNLVSHSFRVWKWQGKSVSLERAQLLLPSTFDRFLSLQILVNLALRGKGLNVLVKCLAMSTQCDTWQCLSFQDAHSTMLEWLWHLKKCPPVFPGILGKLHIVSTVNINWFVLLYYFKRLFLRVVRDSINDVEF